MGAWSILGLIVSALLSAIIVMARRQGKKRQEIKQIEQQNQELSQDAKVDAEAPLHGDDLRNAWNNKLRDNKTK